VATGTHDGHDAGQLPAVFLGERICRLLPVKIVRNAAAAIFAAIGVWVLLDLLG